jgi:predicted AlkP superfamily pyrophosphatase or phosphodiesterase
VPAAQPVVLAISVDGLNPDALTTLGRSGVPSFWRLIDGGASTLNARTDHGLTITLPNHTGMLTGRPVAGASGTSVTFNDDDGSTLEQVHGAYVPGMFDVAHDHGVGTALFAEKDKFAFLVRSWDRNHGAPDVTGADDGPDKLDLAAIAPSTELVGDVTDALTSGESRLVFWHVAAPDAAGHAAGWLGPAYLAAVRDADTQIGAVLDAITAQPELAARTTVLLTADHGGPRGVDHHDDAGLEANYRIPFIAWGAGVRPGADLYALSGGREDPADSSPDSTGPQPVRNTDLAGVALGVLGLPGIDGAPTSALDPIVLN